MFETIKPFPCLFVKHKNKRKARLSCTSLLMCSKVGNSSSRFFNYRLFYTIFCFQTQFLSFLFETKNLWISYYVIDIIIETIMCLREQRISANKTRISTSIHFLDNIKCASGIKKTGQLDKFLSSVRKI